MLTQGIGNVVRTASLMSFLLVALAACGGGGGDGDGSVPSSTPSISNLTYSPTSVVQMEGNGEVTLVGTFDFSDPGGDLATLFLTSQGETLSISIAAAAGLKSGTIEGSLLIDTSVIGSYDFSIYVVDAGGRRSNMLSGTFEVKVNDLGTNWTQQSLPLPSGSTVVLKRVRWLNSQYVAVGEGIFTSPDGINWTERQAGVTAMLNDVTWKDGRFVAVGEAGTLLSSPDGVAWTPQTIPAVNTPVLHGVAASGSRFVAVGTQYLAGTGNYTPLILTSSDGLSWQEVPQAFSAVTYRVIWAGNKFVAVGSATGAPNASAVSLTSADGLAWTLHSAANTDQSVLYDIVWSGSQFVAVGYPGAARSADGVTWERTGLGVSVGGEAVAWSGQRFLSCSGVYCASSTNGIDWTTIQLPGVGPYVRGLAWGDTKWVAVGNASLVLTSP